MIVSFRDKRTERFAEGNHVKEFSGLARQAEARLDRQFSIRINDQWRICFEWPKGSPGPTNVEVVDYH